MPRKPTIYEALATKLGREPTGSELKREVDRIKAEAIMELASQGRLSFQRKLSPKRRGRK